jgi:peptidoglycan/LPS O-acetylase OafA/YrhL
MWEWLSVNAPVLTLIVSAIIAYLTYKLVEYARKD